jgi:nucleotidyltransferase substrate binding protein (TIGR01987 family)
MLGKLPITRAADLSLGATMRGLPSAISWWHGLRMLLDLTPLVNAADRLAEGLARYRRDIDDTQIRDGLIQRFEFTYDLAHKLLRRALEEDAANPGEVDRMSFPTLIRTANEQGLLAGDWPQWRTFRDMRNITSHTYDEAKALQVAGAIPDFLDEARALVTRLQGRAGA